MSAGAILAVIGMFIMGLWLSLSAYEGHLEDKRAYSTPDAELEPIEDLSNRIKSEEKLRRKRDKEAWDHSFLELEWETASKMEQDSIRSRVLEQAIKNRIGISDNITGNPWNPTRDMLQRAGYDCVETKCFTGEILASYWSPP